MMRAMKREQRTRASAGVLAFICVLCGGCHRQHRTARVPPAPSPVNRATARKSAPPAMPVGYSEEGLASWYGVPYNGRPAADGEIYNMETLVAAHRLMPFNTWVRVTNLSNQKTVTVRIIDRGPFVDGRLIDLSKAAARQIDLLGPGVGRVRLDVVAAPADKPANDFFAVQVGAFSQYANAETLRDNYARQFGNAHLVLKQGATPVWRVLVGREPSIEAAQQLATVLQARDKAVFVVRLDETEQTQAPGK